jgi:hypothetical protein
MEVTGDTPALVPRIKCRVERLCVQRGDDDSCSWRRARARRSAKLVVSGLVGHPDIDKACAGVVATGTNGSFEAILDAKTSGPLAISSPGWTHHEKTIDFDEAWRLGYINKQLAQRTRATCWAISNAIWFRMAA